MRSNTDPDRYAWDDEPPRPKEWSRTRAETEGAFPVGSRVKHTSGRPFTATVVGYPESKALNVVNLRVDPEFAMGAGTLGVDPAFLRREE